MSPTKTPQNKLANQQIRIGLSDDEGHLDGLHQC
jgi:hypothetical protein